jgi:hypothetical protein
VVAAFLTRSQTKGMSARSLVQDSGAQSSSLRIALNGPPTSSALRDEERVRRFSSARRAIRGVRLTGRQKRPGAAQTRRGCAFAP